jgi:hypothetical protein
MLSRQQENLFQSLFADFTRILYSLAYMNAGCVIEETSAPITVMESNVNAERLAVLLHIGEV